MKRTFEVEDSNGISRNAAGHPHITHLDGLRALAAMIVVISHCDVWTSRVSLHLAWWLAPLEFIGNLSVPTFIVLSG